MDKLEAKREQNWVKLKLKAYEIRLNKHKQCDDPDHPSCVKCNPSFKDDNPLGL